MFQNYILFTSIFQLFFNVARRCRAQHKTVTFFPELNEPARPTAARPVSRDTGGRASAVRTERRGEAAGIRPVQQRRGGVAMAREGS